MECLMATPMIVHNRKGLQREVLISIRKGVEKCAVGLDIELTDDQMIMLCHDIVEKYEHDSIEDVLLALKHGRQGRYGNVYGKLNMIVVGDWMEQHLSDKAGERIAFMQADEEPAHRWSSHEEYVASVSAGEIINREIDKRKQYRLDNERKYQAYRMDYEMKRKANAN